MKFEYLGSQVLGFFVAQFPKQILNLTQSEHFIVRDVSQKILSSASLPKGSFNIYILLILKSEELIMLKFRQSSKHSFQHWRYQTCGWRLGGSTSLFPFRTSLLPPVPFSITY